MLLSDDKRFLGRAQQLPGARTHWQVAGEWLLLDKLSSAKQASHSRVRLHHIALARVADW